MYEPTLLRRVGHPYESYVKRHFGRQPVDELMLVQAIGLADLSLRTIAIDGMLEFAFRHTHQHFHTLLPFVIGNFAHEHTERKGRMRVALGCEKSFDVALQTKMLGFRKNVTHDVTIGILDRGKGFNALATNLRFRNRAVGDG